MESGEFVGAEDKLDRPKSMPPFPLTPALLREEGENLGNSPVAEKFYRQ